MTNTSFLRPAVALLLLGTPMLSDAQGARSDTSRAAVDWAPLTRLLGSWVASPGSGGDPGTAIRTGETWSRELDGKVIVRRYFSEYPATSRRAAFRHEGFTVIAPTETGAFIANDFDNEGHVINYAVAAADSAIVFTSIARLRDPRFRLTYRPSGTAYAVEFEISSSGDPTGFRKYVSGVLNRSH
jgi:hypothetical protein